MLQRSRTILLLSLLLMFTFACSALDTRDKQLLISGTSLQAGSEQFVQVGTLYNRMYESKAITPEQYRPWAQFANHFKAAYPAAVDSWIAVQKNPNTELQAKLEVVLRDMLAGLTKFSTWIIPFLSPPIEAVPLATIPLAPAVITK